MFYFAVSLPLKNTPAFLAYSSISRDLQLFFPEAFQILLVSYNYWWLQNVEKVEREKVKKEKTNGGKGRRKTCQKYICGTCKAQIKIKCEKY